ncbi:MAG: HAD family hydrolase [Clostridia bacterium]|nr:HAD family hydrolase [Clostridia bacterium]
MKITTVLFDLDGTLLPMDQNVFVKAYFGGLAKRLAPLGYDPQKLIEGIWSGTAAMVKNDGSQLNEDAFWECFVKLFGEKAREDIPVFDAFYREDFDKVAASCGYTPAAKQVVELLKSRGIRVALATNPIFPSIATEKRMRWAGLSPEDFAHYTTYENSRHCKPNPAYYEDILRELKLTAEECLMVGNDVGEDMIAETLGMKVFLLTDCIINKKDEDISHYPHGDFAALTDYLNRLIPEKN